MMKREKQLETITSIIQQQPVITFQQLRENINGKLPPKFRLRHGELSQLLRRYRKTKMPTTSSQQRYCFAQNQIFVTNASSHTLSTQHHNPHS